MFKIKYFWPYLLFFFSIAALVWANVYILNRSIDRNQRYAHTLNVAAGQRTLSMQILNGCYQLHNGTDVRQRLSNELEYWNRIHYSLQNNEGQFYLAGTLFSNKDSLYNILNPVQQQLYADVKLILQEGMTPARLNRVTRHETLYLPLMEQVTNNIEKQAHHEINAVREKESLIVLISGFILVLEMIFFIYPYHKRLVYALKKLKEQREEIDVQAEELHYMNETQGLIIKGIKAGVWEWDISSGEETWSPRFFNMLGYEPGEIPATFDFFLNHLLHPEDFQRVTDAIDNHLKQHITCTEEIRMQCKDGRYRWFEASGQALWDEQGNAVRMAGSIIDIDQNIVFRNKLLQTKEELEKANNSKNKLFSIVAHDLRSPLAALTSLIELQNSDIISREEYQALTTQVGVNLNNLSSIMDNLLHWAQSQMGGLHRTPGRMRVNDCITDAINLYGYALQLKKITINYNSSEEVFAHADHDQVFLIIRNLLNNAIKFTPDNGSIDIISTVAEDKAKVIIKDSGIGMSHGTLQTIKDNKYQFSTQGTMGEKGSGLGLNLCFEMAEENGGYIDVESDPGKGSTFTLVLPAGKTGI